MRRQPSFIMIGAGLTLSLMVMIGTWSSHGNEEPSEPVPEGIAAAINKTTADYVSAFNRGDAEAIAEMYTAEAEFEDTTGEMLNGRSAIKTSFASFFEANPKASIAVQVESVRPLGRGLATAIGVVRLELPDVEPVVETRYSALHVLEGERWRVASVREWMSDPATAVTPEQLEWLVGEWTASGDNGTVHITYTWDESRVFLQGRYTIAQDAKVVSSGTQVIGRSPTGGLRSWLFDSSGTTQDAIWTRDHDRWLSEGLGILPDGTEITSLNVMIRLGKDTFTWQTIEREADGVPLPALPPIRVNRVTK